MKYVWDAYFCFLSRCHFFVEAYITCHLDHYLFFCSPSRAGTKNHYSAMHMSGEGAKPELPRGHTGMLMSVAKQRAVVTMTYGSGHVLPIAECYYSGKCLSIASIWECWHYWIF